jgi:class 3 adenylate cyclase
MNNVFTLFSFTLFYFQLDNVFKACLYDKFELFQQEAIIFYPVIQSANIFILSVFSLFTAQLIFFSKIQNYTIYSMAFIYMKYVMDTILNNNGISIYQYEFRRTIMWLFTTPLILKLYCDMNNLQLKDVNAHYHIISNLLHIILYPFRKTCYNSFIISLLSLSEGYFVYKLLEFKEQKYTKFIIYIWTLFSFITLLEVMNLFSVHDIQVCYLLADMIAKLTTMLIVNDYEEQTYYIKSNIDLQSISLLSVINKSIKHFQSTINTTPKCERLINQLTVKLLDLVPTDKTTLKLELLKKILPLELEDKYLTQSKEYKPFNFVCVLFTDIVSYTELAKQYDDDVIYKMLNDIYTRFDDIVLRYGNLQKIETIGDAYMVVGDIYTNDTKSNVKNMILLAIDFVKEIKKISNPSGKPLQLRVGVNIGKVVVGILGVEIPRLCVIGNTVNVASRLQTTIDPDTIQMSRHVYEIAEQTDFGFNVQFERKENVFLKNLGTTNTFVISPIS